MKIKRKLKLKLK